MPPRGSVVLHRLTKPTNTRINSLHSPRPVAPAAAKLSSSRFPLTSTILHHAYNQIRHFHKPNMPTRDPSTASNYDAWRTKHTTAALTIDFASKSLRGTVTLSLESQTDSASTEIILDSSHVSVSRVLVNAAAAKWTIAERAEPLGSPVHITVPSAAKGAIVEVAIDVATTDKCTALQWLTPAQTGSRRAPFMFSQCQAIHARSLFPCQDTPDVKSTVSFRITSPYVVLASGVAVEEEEEGEELLQQQEFGKERLYSFEQKVPIPSYLFALASGDLAQASIGPRSSVATGPGELAACKWEFERDMEKFMEVAEGLVFPYRWGQYNVLVLPPSFPYGGEFYVCRVSELVTKTDIW